MSPSDPTQSNVYRALIAEFLRQRLEAKLEKLTETGPNLTARRSELLAQFVPTIWLEDAARRVGQIQAVTHSLKPLHPDAKGSSLFREPQTLAPIKEVGSHTLGLVFDIDVVGNAATLDVYKFLKLEHKGRSFLILCSLLDVDLAFALSPDPTIAKTWMQAFARLGEPRGKLSSHTQAKQIYWPVGDDPHDDASYHLLAPLYPTSLVHRFYQMLQDDRFGDAAKEARAARKADAWHVRPVREYPHLAIQKLGGTKPQNISQLNSERRGENYLLASLPPAWQSNAVKPVHGVPSLFAVFRWRRDVRRLTGQIRGFLESDPARNRESRRRRDELVEALLDELLQFAAEIRTLVPGWSADSACQLPSHQMEWLDPTGVSGASGDMIDRMASDFSHWLNGQLREPLMMGDAEYLHWLKQARELFKALEREGVYEQ